MWTLYNDNFRIRVLAITQLQANRMNIQGWMTKDFFVWPYFYYAIFYNTTSPNNATTALQ